MQHRKRALVLAWGVTLCALGLALQASCSRNKTKEVASEATLKVAPEAPVNEASDPAAAREAPQALPPEIEELNKVQKELAQLNDEALGKEEEKLNAMMKENDLMDRMNKKIATDSEKAHGKKILIRLALIRVEKSKRSTNIKKPAQG